MARLNFYPGFPDEFEDTEELRKTAALRVRAANMIAAGDGINQSLLGALLEDAETILTGLERCAKRMPMAFDPKELPPLEAVARQALAISLAMSGADFSDKQDLEALEELTVGLTNALDRYVEREKERSVAPPAHVLARRAKRSKKFARAKRAA